MDLSDVLRPNICTIDKPKHKYNHHSLQLLCKNYICKEYSEFYNIYTDGSKSNSELGAAFIDSQTRSHVKLRLNTNVSIMTAEMIAIAEALAYSESIDCDKIVIYGFQEYRPTFKQMYSCS